MEDKKIAITDSFGFQVNYYICAGILCYLVSLRLFLILPGGTCIPMVMAAALVFLFGFCWLLRVVNRWNGKKRQCFFACTCAYSCINGFFLFIGEEKSQIWLLLYGLCVILAIQALKKRGEARTHRMAAMLGLIFALFSFLGSQLARSGGLEILHVTADRYRVGMLLLQLAGISLFYTLGLDLFFNSCLEKAFSPKQYLQNRNGLSPNIYIYIYL